MFIGNWKMNKTVVDAKSFVTDFLPQVKSSSDLIVLAVPFTAIFTVSQMTQGSNVFVAAENIYEEEEGAYTGEVSAKMVKEAGARYVILGHSERRNYFQESHALVNKKIKISLKHGLRPIVCIGETLDEREEGLTEDILEEALENTLLDLTQEDMESIFIAYEPIWAIGTGVASTAEEAGKVHDFCRKWIAHKWGQSVADKQCILYGGSVKEENIDLLLKTHDIDGVLVGGASLNSSSFAHIINI